MNIALSFAAALPLISVLVLLVMLRMPAIRAMPISFLLTSVVALLVWQMDGASFMASLVQAGVITAEVVFILFGAILLLNIYRESGAIEQIRQSLDQISPDRRIQAVFIGWLFGGFIEGVSGFGTPAAVVAPLLSALGFPLAAAVTTGLIIQSTPVSFGAMGTPMILGLGSGLDSRLVRAVAEGMGLRFDQYIKEIAQQVALIHSLIGFLIPLILVVVLTSLYGRKKGWREVIPVWRFALFAGIAFVVPYSLTAHYLGPEFPSLVGGIVGMLAALLALRSPFFIP